MSVCSFPHLKKYDSTMNYSSNSISVDDLIMDASFSYSPQFVISLGFLLKLKTSNICKFGANFVNILHSKNTSKCFGVFIMGKHYICQNLINPCENESDYTIQSTQ